MGYIAVIISLFAASSITATPHSEPYRIGFMGMRGKRSIEDSTYSGILPPTIVPIATNTIRNETSLPELPNYMRNLPELSIFKRAPVGFMGMRGKKDFEYSGYSRRSAQEGQGPRGKKIFLNMPNRVLLNSNPKRAPSGFMGMRGKKLIENNLLESEIKRAPSGFMGMRGKKDLSEENEYMDPEEEIDFFQNLQNERELINDLRQLYDIENRNNLDWRTEDELNKRAPSGFMGMRGKKFYNDAGYSEDGWVDKRAPSGFLGMRGKRNYDFANDMYEEEKRAPKGFMGMRGKKDDFLDSAEKRSSLAQYFGIRGKKQPLNSGFFGMRGKKQPFEFRGKFVGVRGKKIPDGSLQRLEFQLNDIPSDGSSSTNILTSDVGDAVKRAPSGFVGMRGKKWQEDTSISEEQNE